MKQDKFQEIPNISLDLLLRFPGIILEKYMKKKVSENELQKFSLKFERVRNGGEFRKIENEIIKSAELVLNSRDGLVLYYLEIPVVALSYSLELINDENIFLINQIQLVKLFNNRDMFFSMDWFETGFSPNRYLELFDWQKAIVKIAEIIAKYDVDTKYLKVAIITAKTAINNPNNQYRGGLRKDKAEENYNVTAIYMNYKLFDENIFIKNLN
jgi:hypothetical protein